MARILIVDDDSLVRDHAALCLRGAGHEVATAADGETALRMSGRGYFDLVFTDVYMDGIDGFGLVRRMLDAHGPLMPPVVFMSSVEDRENYRRAFRSRAADFLIKPIGCRELREAVGARLAGDDSERHAYPRRIAGFHIRRPLGTGSTASVFLATRVPAGEECALKIIHLPEDVSGQPDAIRRFDHEFAILEGISHPGIAKVSEHGVADDCLYIAMEYFPGGSLDARAGQALPPAEAIDACLQIAEALRCIHAQGIVHRDLKPSNVMRRDDGSLALVDFGIARRESQHATSGDTLGTPLYMSPEHFSHERVDARADVYALGCILYQMLTGELPFRGDSIAELFAAHSAQARPRLPAQLAFCQPTLDRMLALDRKDRFPDGAACALALWGLRDEQARRERREQMASRPDFEIQP